MKGFGLVKDSLSNSRKHIGVGYIFIPDNFKGEGRNIFVKNCYRNHRVSIVLDEGLGIKHNCFILESVLRDIKFPDISISEQGKGKLGSQVVFFNEPYHDHTIIIGVINKRDETLLYEENEYRIIKDNKGKYALLSINGNTGSIGINSFGGNMNIFISNENQDVEMNVGVSGSININAIGNINISTKGNINLTPSTFNVGSENLEPSLKGTTTSDELVKDGNAMKELQNALNNWTPVPNDGGAALKVALATFLTKAMADYSDIKSSKVFLE